MSLLFSLMAHLLVTLARLAKPGGLSEMAAESLAVKRQLLILARGSLPAPKSSVPLHAGSSTLY
jgi:hypothetical protein